MFLKVQLHTSLALLLAKQKGFPGIATMGTVAVLREGTDDSLQKCHICLYRSLGIRNEESSR